MDIPFPENSWNTALAGNCDIKNMKQIKDTVTKAYQTSRVLPARSEVFNAYKYTPYDKVKVVILGQDPYPTPGDAMGLSFSVKPGRRIPASLHNIYKERQDDLGIAPSNTGDLTPWTSQGVLLLNATLTVLAGQRNSMSNIGWQQFTDETIKVLNKRAQSHPIVYILWGRNARNKKDLIDTDNPNICIIESTHPSPLSASHGFFGSKPFSRANRFLEAHGVEPIDWSN